jgi:Na+/H+ antiporter NhaD/arsenite permease-like protein
MNRRRSTGKWKWRGGSLYSNEQQSRGEESIKSACSYLRIWLLCKKKAIMQYTALIIFIITYLGIIFTRLPGVNIDRPSAAFFGSVAMVLFGVMSFEEAVYAVDYNTIALLLGMMIIISTLQLDGFFSMIAQKTISYSKTRFRLLTIIVLITGISSAFLVNDAVVLLFTPVIITICTSSKLNPLPYLIAEILSSNAGSVMTITGNPQNMLIGVNSGISYGQFLLTLLPLALVSMVVIILVVRLVYARHFRNKDNIQFEAGAHVYSWRNMRISVPVFAAVIVLFFFAHRIQLSIPLIALAGASVMLLSGSVKPSRVIKEVDWVLLVFFAALFIVVRGIENTGLLSHLVNAGMITNDAKGVISLHGLSLLMSQIVSNVPYTVVMLPFMKAGASAKLWLALAASSTLAGNATIIGAMANLIVIESAKKQGIHIRFFEFLKAGIVVAIVTMSFSIVYFCLLI